MMAFLDKKGFTSLYIDGGKLTQRALACLHVNEMIITTIPILLGDGIALFETSKNLIPLKLMGSEILLDQCVKTHDDVLRSQE